jgi:hypothetical protein
MICVSVAGCILVGCMPPPERQQGYMSSTTTATSSNTTIAGNTTYVPQPSWTYEEPKAGYLPIEAVSQPVTVPSTTDSIDDPVIEPGDPALDESAAMDTVESLPESVAVAPPAGMPNLVPIEIQLPAPAFRGTPVPMEEPNVEKPRGEPRPPFLAPAGTVNLALGKSVVCSDPIPTAGELDLINDGDKEASDFGYLELRPGSEWVQIGLDERSTVYAVVLWHNHAEARVYRDVIVQVSDDPDFLECETVFNNDYDNTSGLGIGSDMGYVETSEGKLIDCRGVEGRFVRLYSSGSTVDGKNHYTEVEIYGRPGA